MLGVPIDADGVRASEFTLVTDATYRSGFGLVRRPTEDRPKNLIEQINQTFTYLASVRTACWLLEDHPEAGSLRLNLGTVAGSDIESLDGLVAAETFASVNPRNDDKLKDDIVKVSATAAIHKYVFYICPSHPVTDVSFIQNDVPIKVVSLGWYNLPPNQAFKRGPRQAFGRAGAAGYSNFRR